jgi:secondary thiamine-phosphate synthase enzyme
MQTIWHDLVVSTLENNLAEHDPRLAELSDEGFHFSLHDLTDQLAALVTKSGIQHGLLTAQSMHTTAVMCINEFNEPMLLLDIARALEHVAPQANDYLHNSQLRTANLCGSTVNTDRNADAHIKAFVSGSPSATVLIRNGKLHLGGWQRFALIDYDGPRDRTVTIQIIGE